MVLSIGHANTFSDLYPLVPSNQKLAFYDVLSPYNLCTENLHWLPHKQQQTLFLLNNIYWLFQLQIQNIETQVKLCYKSTLYFVSYFYKQKFMLIQTPARDIQWTLFSQTMHIWSFSQHMYKIWHDPNINTRHFWYKRVLIWLC